MRPAYRYRGWIGNYSRCHEWSVPVSDDMTIRNLWELAERQMNEDERRRGLDGWFPYSPWERIQVEPVEDDQPQLRLEIA